MRSPVLLATLMLVTALEPDALAQTLPEEVLIPEAARESGESGHGEAGHHHQSRLEGRTVLSGRDPKSFSDERVEAIEQDTLLKLAAPLLKEAMMQAVRQLPAQAGFVRLKDLKEAGLPFDFDTDK